VQGCRALQPLAPGAAPCHQHGCPPPPPPQHTHCWPAGPTDPRPTRPRYFYTKLYLGTPPSLFTVIIDTGSTITYVPCASCGSQCGKHQDEAFNPAKSSTYADIACSSDRCDCGSPPCKCVDNKCFYSR
jgi:hypothetical protein